MARVLGCTTVVSVRGAWNLRETKSVFLLSVRPHPPCGMALRIRYSFPTFHKDSIADNRLNRLAQRLLGYLVCCAWRHIDIRCLHRDDEPVPAIGIHLHGVRRLGYSGRLFAVIPQMRSNEDEQQNQGHHHVVVETAPRVGPEEVAFQNLARKSTRLNSSHLVISY